MAYSRWSSDSHRSDVYVYESHWGFETHVAATHPMLPDDVHAPGWQLILDGDFDAWMEAHETFQAVFEAAPRVPVHPSWAGQSFTDTEPGACADRLDAMRADGVHVPAGVIESLREDQAGLNAVR